MTRNWWMWNNLVYRVSAFPVYTPHGPAAPNEANTIKNNILAFGVTSRLKFWVQDGCLYAGGAAYAQFRDFTSNIHWRTDGAFAAQPDPVTSGGNAPCNGNTNNWTFCTFNTWQGRLRRLRLHAGRSEKSADSAASGGSDLSDQNYNRASQ